MIKKNNRKTIRGWVFYDWANSVYNLVISSAIFPIFYETVTKKKFLAQYNETNGTQWESVPEGVDALVNFFGYPVSSSVLMSFTLSASFFVVSVLSPMLSGVADYTGNKKMFLKFFCYLGSLACISFYWFDALPLEVGMISVFLASIGFWNSLVFYNAYLPEIASPRFHDRISARGYMMGYFGSMLLLVLCLLMITFGGAHLTKYSFILVGLWWIGFSQITYKALPNVEREGKKVGKGVLLKGFNELKSVFKEFVNKPRLKRYLVSFFFFNTGVQTVMLMAVLYAKKEIFSGQYEELAQTGLIVSILLIQLLGALGAVIISRLSEKIGNLKALSIVVFLWIPLVIWAYFLKTPNAFYVLAACVGILMGGVQSLSRSTYSKFLPETGDHASYFSFYDATEKIGIVAGTFFFGLMEIVFNDIRMSIVSIAFFFIVGFIMIFRVPNDERLAPVKKIGKLNKNFN